MELIGKSTIHPVLFYSGKICGYLLWIFYLIEIINIRIIKGIEHPVLIIASIIILLFGLILTVVSLINLGKSTRLGIPTVKTEFKTNGIYKISRNPMYLGFNCITIAAIIYNINVFSVIFGIYCIIVYHLIILGEEVFLERSFGNKYKLYKQNVRRYI